MTQQQPPGSGPSQPDSPTQSYPTPPPPPQGPGGYPPPPPPPPPPPGAYPAQPGGYYAPPPPPGPGGVYMSPPPSPENHTARNVVIGVIIALLLIGILGVLYAVTRPQSTLPPVTPSPTAVAVEPTASKTPKPQKTENPATEKPATEKPATEPPATDKPATEPPVTEEPATEPPATDVPASAVPPTGFAPSPGATIPGTEEQGIILGNPVWINDFIPEVILLTQNIEDTVATYSVKATFKNGSTITATATGIVSTHVQGSIRVATLFIDGTPGDSDTLTVALDSMIDQQDSTPEGDVAKQVTFGQPTITVGLVSSVDVDVTNGSDTTADITVVGGILREGQLVGTATGFLQAVEPGQTQTATLVVSGDIAVTDQVLMTVDSVSIPSD